MNSGTNPSCSGPTHRDGIEAGLTDSTLTSIAVLAAALDADLSQQEMDRQVEALVAGPVCQRCQVQLLIGIATVLREMAVDIADDTASNLRAAQLRVASEGVRLWP